MARSKGTVFLGYQDEEITERYKSQLNYTVSKVGGIPDWIGSDIKIGCCPICDLNRPLLLQIYAPLESSLFHRTLYIFACLNPICSIKSRGWLCVRAQTIDKQENQTVNLIKNSKKSNSFQTTWCEEADDWGEGGSNVIEILPPKNARDNEENGNVINHNNKLNNLNKNSDDEESIDNDVIFSLTNLNVDEKNANCGAQGAVGNFCGIETNTFAEIEGEESELVTMESPVIPERDLVALMKQTTGLPAKLKDFTLKSFFIYVEEEKNFNYLRISDHVRELMQDYQQRDEMYFVQSSIQIFDINACDTTKEIEFGSLENELYEKSVPAHGDLMFHNFMSTLQENPGQIVRYSRESFPLLISPLVANIPNCDQCGGECICELQILPSLIPLLKLQNNDLAPIEYGNVLVFTCSKSCWDVSDKIRIEHILVQQEA